MLNPTLAHHRCVHQKPEVNTWTWSIQTVQSCSSYGSQCSAQEAGCKQRFQGHTTAAWAEGCLTPCVSDHPPAQAAEEKPLTAAGFHLMVEFGSQGFLCTQQTQHTSRTQFLGICSRKMNHNSIPSFFPSQRSSFDYFRCRPRVTQIDPTLESIHLPASELRHTKYARKLTGKPELPGQGWHCPHKGVWVWILLG